MIKSKKVRFIVRKNESIIGEFFNIDEALKCAEKFGGKVYKLILTVEELERIADGVWA